MLLLKVSAKRARPYLVMRVHFSFTLITVDKHMLGSSKIKLGEFKISN